MNLLNRIQEACEKFSSEIAITEDNNEITYKNLWRNAHAIANQILKHNITDSCVAIYLDNKTDTIASIIGVLLSGNHYLCLPNRIEDGAVTKHVNVTLYISNNKALRVSGVPTINLPQNIIYTTINNWWKTESIAQKWCCVYCTSGSSGSAKYVVHDYQTIEEDTYRQIEENNITSKDNIDFLYHSSFSSALASIFPTLITGAKIVAFNFSKHSILDLAEFWSNNQITFTTMVPSSFRSLGIIFGDQLKDFNTSLRYVSLGGEKVLNEDISMFKQLYHNKTELQIAYASTETRTAAQAKINKSSSYSKSHVGKSVRLKNIYIHKREVLENKKIGEIVVQSKFICVGYLKNKKLKKLLTRQGERIYKTGDLGYFTKNGNLKITGRTNSLIKVNGKYFDLHILEKKLTKITNTNCVVINQQGVNQLEYLVAFIETDKTINIADLKKEVKIKIESVIYPKKYIIISKFPYNQNGKLDRLALKKLDNQNTKKIEIIESDEILSTIINSWKKSLELDKFSIHDDFFTDLGGSSIVSMIALNEIEQILKIKLDNYSIFNERTAYKLANSIQEKTKYPRIELVNEEDINKPYLFFLQSSTGFNYDNLITSSLTLNFNIAYLRYDFYSVLKGKSSSTIINEMGNILKLYKNLILVGYSFNGFLATKIVEKINFVAPLVCIDTPFYKKGKKTIINKPLRNKLNFLFSKSAEDILKLLKQKLLKKKKKEKRTPNSFDAACNKIIQETESINKINHLLYFYALQPGITSSIDISLWKKKSKKSFKVINISGDHTSALNKENGSKTSNEIITFYNEVHKKYQL